MKREETENGDIQHIESSTQADGDPSRYYIIKANRCEKTLLCIVCLFLLIIAVLVVVIVLDHTFHLRDKVCTTPVCIKVSARILDRLDPTVDPCEDFYHFSCGKFVATQAVPDDLNHVTTFQEMEEDMKIIIKKIIEKPINTNDSTSVKKAKLLYASCINTSFEMSPEELSSPIYQLLTSDRLGVWPLLNESLWKEEEFSLEKTLAELFTHQVSSFFEIYVYPDEENSQKYILQFFKGSTSIDREYFLNSSNADFVRYIHLYRALIEKTIRLLKVTDQVNVNEIDKLIEFERNFADITNRSTCSPPENITSPEEEMTSRMTVAELVEFAPWIDWYLFFNHTFQKVGLDLDIPSMTVTFTCKAYLTELIELLASVPSSVVSNYLLWRFAMKYLPYLGSVFQQLWEYFKKEVPIVLEDNIYFSRWKDCVFLVNNVFDMVTSNQYVEKYYDPIVEVDVKQIFEEMKWMFNTAIEKQTWINQEERDRCIEKLDGMELRFGFPKIVQNLDLVDQEYRQLSIEKEHFFLNMLKIKRFEASKKFNKLTRLVDKDRDWLMPPLTVNAFHSPTANELVLPIGILMYPIYIPNAPKYIHYSSLGLIVSHEIAHAFDVLGRRYTKYGNVTRWWSNEVVDRFVDQVLCFVNQYSQYPLLHTEKTIDGHKTLGENMCDSIALTNAWRAYQQDKALHGDDILLPGITYTQDQVFFINSGQVWCEVLNQEGYEYYIKDTHSPGHYRVVGAVQNNPFFAQVFNCPIGSPMNPEKKCTLWA